ncbi:MAG: BlaI/MecI/CopY family transcriptional regulator [Ruminococcaceae bacterium]|nr:BlaI/MecI/CopY family transcriptional regulator [Oscillospiraceae bacterium]
MSEMKLGAVESRFADIIWNNEPLTSGELVKLAEKELTWKRTTTYTILKRLCDRGIFKNEHGTVSSLISRDEFYALQSEKFVDETFDGSLPAFLAAFSKRKKLSDKEVDELRRVIDSMKG